ncbi:ANTAR domain-containing protein [Nocardioides sp. MH1]|uniref:ANTAR domain-containing protein n=1 Tax=Nocardioides sp. MH1 TaxID=3242490 RepID=UPI00352102BF
MLDIAKCRELDADRVAGDPTDRALLSVTELAARLCDVALAVVSIDGEDDLPGSLADPAAAAERGYAFHVTEPLVARDGSALGVLCLLSHESRELTEEQRGSLAGVAALASDQVALRNQAREARRTADQLQDGLISNRTIGKALGLMMAQYALDDDEAFTKLRNHSRDLNMKIRDLAERIVAHHNGGTRSAR